MGNAGFARMMTSRVRNAANTASLTRATVRRPAPVRNRRVRTAVPGLFQEAPSEGVTDFGYSQVEVPAGHSGSMGTLLQRARSLIQRTVITGPSVGHTTAELTDMTLNTFHQFAQDQVDWFNNPAISNQERWQLRGLLTFATRPGVLSGCGEMKVSDLLATHVVTRGGAISPAIAAPLEAYSVGVSQDVETVQLMTPAPDPPTALKWGRALTKLQAVLDGATLNKTMHQVRFQELVERSLLDGFIHYVRASHPIIEAEKTSGADEHDEVASYINMRNEGRDPAFYEGTVLNRYISNFHRFHRETLDTLITHFNGRNLPNAARKPLTLILHTAHDHNGAFHRDPNLLAVVKDTNINTLMIEGRETLADVAADLDPLARAYGKSRKIDQVMFAGHGDARSIELGTSEEIDLDADPGKANALFDAVLRNMADDPAVAPHRRIVFNACLTNSNSVPMPLNATRATAQKEVRDHISANSSLATYLQQRARAQGLTSIEVKGANGSFGTVGLIDAADGLDIISTLDPSLTANKAEYVKTGTEPEGVLRAVLECWSGFNEPDPEVARQETLKAMEDRAGTVASPKAAADYRDAIIKTLFQIILARYRENGEMIRRFAEVGYRVSELEFEGEDCRVDKLGPAGLHPGGTTAAEASTVFSGVLPKASGLNSVQLVIYQVYMRHDDTKVANFLTTLASFDCQSAADFLDAPFITPVLAKVLPDTTTPTREQLLVAFRVLDTDNTQADAKAFLLKAVGAGNRRFPAALGVDAILNGRPSQQVILQKLGLVPDDSGSAVAAGGDQKANLDLDGDGTNETYVEPLPGVRGHSPRGRVPTYARPDTASAFVRNLWRTQPLYVVGQVGDFYAIQNPWEARRVIFVEKVNVARD